MENNKKTRFSQVQFRYEHLVGGLSGGVTSTLILHPLDLIKIRFAVSDGLHLRPKYTSMWSCAKAVWISGGIRGLYRGVTPNILGNGVSWGLYFFYYNTIKVFLGDGSANPELSVPKYLLCGCIAGSLTLAVTNPIWIAKTRLCLEYESTGPRYRGMLHVVSDLYRNDGVKGLYKGFVPGLIGTTHGAVQFLVYEKLKHSYRLRINPDENVKMGVGETLLMSASSKFVAVVSTYPYQVIRSRLQDQHKKYNGIRDVIVTTWRNETWRGFYKGMAANLLRVTPSCCITFYIYENILYYLNHGFNNKKKQS